MSTRTRQTPQSLGLPPAGVDTHAHLDLPDLCDEIGPALDRALDSGLKYIGNVFLGPWAYAANQAAFHDRPEVFFVLGMHPHDAQKADQECLHEMEQALTGDSRIKAVGEIGLDYFRDHAPHDQQRSAFVAQLEMAADHNMPVVIHSRAAEEETLDLLDRAGFPDRPLLWHCFGGGPELAQAVLDRGWMLSIPGIVTFPKAGPVQEAVRHIPLDRMVLETDCPFLAPDPYRGKRNEPALTAFTAQKVAELRGEDVALVWEQTGRNACRFFGLQE